MAQGLYDIASLEPLLAEGCVLLTPNYRLARRIKLEWDTQQIAAGKTAWEPLPVQPLEGWLLTQWQLAVSLDLLPPVVPLSPNQELEIWRQVIRQQERLDSAFHLLRPAATADLANQARDALQRWQIDMDDHNVKQLFNLERDCGTFLVWLNLFEKRLQEAGQCTTADCLTHLARVAERLPPATVVLLEFGEMAPLEQLILERLSAELQEFQLQTRQGQCLLHAFDDKRAELKSVASWAAQLHRTTPQATIGIVLGDMHRDRVSLEYLLRQEMDCIGQHYNRLPVNFSTGVALAKVPLVRDALRSLSMGLQDTSVSAVVALLRSRFLAFPQDQDPLALRLIERLYAQGAKELPVFDVQTAATRISVGEEKEHVLAGYLRGVSRTIEQQGAAPPSVWADCFSELLDIWGWPGSEPLDSLEYQQLDSWRQALQEFKGFDAVSKNISFEKALHLLHDTCERQVSQPQTADSPIQVLGPLEAAGLTFEHFWLCGMQSGSWPAAPRPNPLIPVSLQSRLQMPRADVEREWSMSEGLLARYLRTNSKLHASYCRQIDGVPVPPSALLTGFELAEVEQPRSLAEQWWATGTGSAMEYVPDGCAPAVDLKQGSGATGGSSLIEDQSQCPFRAFTRHRLHVEPLGSFALGLSAADRGSLLHAALFELWGEIVDHAALVAMSMAQQESVIIMAVESAITALRRRTGRRLGDGYWKLEGRRLKTLLAEWLGVERQREAFSVEQREEDLTLHLASLQIQLRVDRVDLLSDGSRMIIDYKSGHCGTQDWMGDRLAQPQLPLYSIAESNNVAALTYAQVRSRHCRFVGLGRLEAAPGVKTLSPVDAPPDVSAADWDALIGDWRQTLQKIVEEFIAGEASVDPLSPSSCTWCGLQSLCRIAHTEESVEGQA